MAISGPHTIRTSHESILGFTRSVQPAKTIDLISALLTKVIFRPVKELYFAPQFLEKYPNLPARIVVPPECGLLEAFFYVNSRDDSVQKIDSWVQEYLSKQRLVFFNDRATTLFKLSSYCLRKLNMHVSDFLSPHFSKEELSLIGITQNIVERFRGLLSPKKLQCFHFALMKAKEVGVRELVFNYDNGNNRTILEQLPRWGYQIVTDFKPNDLVLYLNDGVPTHMGIFVTNEAVLSKNGPENSYYIQHPVEATWSIYGLQFVVYRKIKEGVYDTRFPVLQAALANRLNFT